MADKIFYTKTDEAPALATYSFLPIVKSFIKCADIDIVIKDISLASRILAKFSDMLTEKKVCPDALAELSRLVKTPLANIIKLPNISASVPQLKSAVKELQNNGYKLPDYPERPVTAAEIEVRARYTAVLGSAVNPLLREGNSDRRVAEPVKQFAKDNPHSIGKWNKESKSHVAHMDDGDFYSSEKSIVVKADDNVRIELVGLSGTVTVLKKNISLLKEDIIDAAVMNCRAFCSFFEEQIKEAKKNNILLSLHLKATMMKVSDPIIFGHAVTVYYKELFEKYSALFAKLDVEPNNGIGDVYEKIQKLPPEQRVKIEREIQNIYNIRPHLAMANFENGITNLHMPNNMIIDASMAAAIRASGQMCGIDGRMHDTKAVIPDRCYAGIYQETIEFCKKYGAFDVATMGSVSNIGLMAQKAEEYGSHDKTFEILEDGVVRIIAESGEVLIEHDVENGDIWRMCQTKNIPINDWVKLAVNRAESTGFSAVFWLDKNRSHDVVLIKKVRRCLDELDTAGLDIKIMSPVKAMRYTLERVRTGENTISVTGNVLRDYLTDLFPILELGSSAKMLSIVPLLAGGSLFETGAGGTAPDLVEQFLNENHLSWDSLGEFLALSVSLEELAVNNKNKRARILASALNQATCKLLKNSKVPLNKVNELDNRGSHFYIALYWAQALAEQNEYKDIHEHFATIAEQLANNEKTIIEELNFVQGKTVNLDGYYYLDSDKIETIMRPSVTFNRLVNAV
jgi:isocitrate dehydrogenase